MTTHVTAIYENGILRPTKPLPLENGDRIEFTVDLVQRTNQSRWHETFDAMASLKDGWNGYAAPRPSLVALTNARNLFNEACNCKTLPARIEPSAMGGVGVTFSAGDREVVAELYNNGTAHALFADNANETMETRSLTPTPEGFRAFLEEVNGYLHGQPTAR